jgi:transcriptional regulator with XRE-family HTH domain
MEELLLSEAEKLPTAFGQVLRQQRVNAGFSQEELAFRCGLDRTYVSGVERGIRNPTLQSAGRLALGVGVPLSTLIKEAEALRSEKGGKNAL